MFALCVYTFKASSRWGQREISCSIAQSPPPPPPPPDAVMNYSSKLSNVLIAPNILYIESLTLCK